MGSQVPERTKRASDKHEYDHLPKGTNVINPSFLGKDRVKGSREAGFLCYLKSYSSKIKTEPYDPMNLLLGIYIKEMKSLC